MLSNYQFVHQVCAASRQLEHSDCALRNSRMDRKKDKVFDLLSEIVSLNSKWLKLWFFSAAASNDLYLLHISTFIFQNHF